MDVVINRVPEIWICEDHFERLQDARLRPTDQTDGEFSATDVFLDDDRSVARNQSANEFAKMLGGYGEEVRDPKDIRPALERARASGKPSLINVWVDPNAFAPGTMNQTMYK